MKTYYEFATDSPQTIWCKFFKTYRRTDGSKVNAWTTSLGFMIFIDALEDQRNELIWNLYNEGYTV